MKMASSSKSSVHTFGGDIEKFSAFQPTDIKPLFGRNWVTNGEGNKNFKIFKDAYDDSPTNASIINAMVSYIFGDGIKGISQYLSDEDCEMCIHEMKLYGGCSLQVIWNLDNKPLKLEYMPIYKLGINYDQKKIEVDGYWYSYDWMNRGRYKPTLYPKFTGIYKGNPLEILYIRRPTSEPFFPIPDYLSGINWAKIEGEIANTGYSHYKNGMGEITVINSNNGMIADEIEAQKEADTLRTKVVGSDNNARTVVSINESLENALTIDRIAPPELAQHNVFYSEEAERKLIVAHSAPPILFQGSNQGSGFSSNAEERAIAIKDLYRRNINPFRKTFINGIKPFFKLVGIDELEFIDFDSEDKLDTTADAVTT